MTTADECAREITWAGGTHTFNLNEPRVRLMMKVRGFPGQFGNTPAACLRRFSENIYSSDDVERVLEWGLIGGGLSSNEANRLLSENVRHRPIAPNAMAAFEVIAALFVGAANVGASA